MMNDLPDAPWIRESWWSGGDPDYEETPYERCGASDFLDGADVDYGWIILADELDVDTDGIEDDCRWQGIWTSLTDTMRKALCKEFEKHHRDDAAELYNKYWKEWRQ